MVQLLLAIATLV